MVFLILFILLFNINGNTANLISVENGTVPLAIEATVEQSNDQGLLSLCDLKMPFCELDYLERASLPESFLHDQFPPEFLKPETDIFLDMQIQVIQGIREKYAYVDPNNIIAVRALELALTYYDRLKNSLKKTQYLGVVDYGKFSHDSRLYVIDMQTGAVEKLLVAHGEGSDPKNTGYAKLFSNTVNSHMSSLGAFITGGTYSGKNGLSLRVDGIETSNSRMKERAVVIHGSDYVKTTLPKIGMSWGCLAVSRDQIGGLINKVKDGVLFLSWYDQ